LKKAIPHLIFWIIQWCGYTSILLNTHQSENVTNKNYRAQSGCTVLYNKINETEKSEERRENTKLRNISRKQRNDKGKERLKRKKEGNNERKEENE
jgi:hypothetical protein